MRNKIIFFLIILLAIFLRFFKLNSFPNGLYSDEAALGYNAFSILKTGKDEYGRLLPLTFQSFGDYKPPLSAYVMIPFIWLFDLNEFSVRFPFALAGVLSVILIYFLVLEIFKKEKNRNLIALLAAFLLAISPWHLGQTRSAMLVGIEAFFNALGVFLFLKGLRKKYWLIFSSISFSLAIYSYYGSRVFVPLLVISLIVLFLKDLMNFKKIVFFISGFFVLLPLFYAIYYNPETLLGRARYMSIFYDKNISGQLWEASTFDGKKNIPVLVARFFHNKPIYYAKDILRRWLEHFEWSFLFLKGDRVFPFYLPRMGLLYLIEWPLIWYGFFSLRRKKEIWVILFWLLLAPLSAALTFMTPASNRSFNMIFPLTMMSAYGLFKILNSELAIKKILNKLIFLSYLGGVIYYFYIYYYLLPYEFSYVWHYGQRELVNKISQFQDKYEKVIIADKGGPPYIFLLFYQKYDPRSYWQTMKIDPFINDLGWGHIDGFDKYEIPRNLEWQEREKRTGVLYITYEEEVRDDWEEIVDNQKLKVNILDKVYYPNGKTAYKILELIPAELK